MDNLSFLGGLSPPFVFKKTNIQVIKCWRSKNSKLTEHFAKEGKFVDLPTIQDEQQTMVDEEQINESLDPVNNALDGFREFSDWLFFSISDLLQSVFGNLM